MKTVVTPSSAGMDEAALARVGAAVQEDIGAGRHYGASILIARGGNIVYRQVLGSVAAGRPAADDDRYLLMSMSKAYTAALVLRAIDHGRFGLDTRVTELVPGFEVAGKARATVRQLLNHTAGLPFGLVPPPLTFDQVGDLPGKVAAINALPAVYTPGTRCIYTSGLGFDLLGQILVNTDSQGRGFRQIVHDDLFVPLGMSDSSFGAPLNDPRRVPVSFTPQNTRPTTPAILHMFNQVFDADAEVPSGNAYSTVDDVFRFTEALRGRGTANGHRLISPALYDYSHQNHTGDLVNEAVTFETEARGLEPMRANYTLLGGYVRGTGHMLTTAGQTASPDAITAVGGASTGWMIDPRRDVTVIFLSAGFNEGLSHLIRLQRINDLALAAVND
ncbi:CubicO group peptidase (beta-lactamase class C family) [Nonomuraea thailandensis]|uniref:CubicO group peptidase (Beta-lactamase class C family) n=1 Tax=Nonomuraea thailandensis TaxID=1188745 RepID=A0A9X2GT81_9ACTN|nr:serine hydrolase domain-containing protein [Nonomuraea thailandensis]MCP2359998.1 CubicO group peptidase (beta-lactamase class C family) [Nonomuraea thailandensis]